MISLDSPTTARILGRPSHLPLPQEARRALAGHAVLITGAGGSIGSELARQVAGCQPRALTLFEQSEYALFKIESEIRRRWPQVAVHAVLGDVTREGDLSEAAALASPDLILHAAAYKHVTMAERAIVAAARANVLGTAEVIALARRSGARLVFVSSDKAAEPVSVMGATKRFAEMLVVDAALPAGAAIVRFGNVLGSSGSVLEVMLESIEQGRPIPLTDPDATRYFMAPAEAVSLVLTAGCARGVGDVFWVDMGEPVRIGDLAARVEAWARDAGYSPAGTVVIGLRDGEKRDEQLTTQGLAMRQTGYAHVWSAVQPPLDAAGLGGAFAALARGVEAGDTARVLEALVDGVPDYIPAAATCARVLPARRQGVAGAGQAALMVGALIEQEAA